jgi:hypothetical protein
VEFTLEVPNGGTEIITEMVLQHGHTSVATRLFGAKERPPSVQALTSKLLSQSGEPFLIPASKLISGQSQYFLTSTPDKHILPALLLLPYALVFVAYTSLTSDLFHITLDDT